MIPSSLLLTFVYNFRANGKHLNLEPYKVTEVGMHNGLKVIVNNDLEDYMYSTAPPAGVKVKKKNKTK